MIMKYNKPKRTFEDSGYVNPKKSYCVSLENVVNRHHQDMKTMVDNGRYFSIFAPRQSGKTTFFKLFSHKLEIDSNYIFILMSFENCETYDLIKFYQHIQYVIYGQLIQRLRDIQCHQVDTVQSFLQTHILNDSYAFYMLFSQLNQLISKKKIVIFIDEFDGIPINEIKNFLTTLRKLYQEYKDKTDKALYSVGLVGIRNITQLIVGGVSPFNIADHIELPPFSFTNIRDLYNQYTQETNQPFTEEAIHAVYEETQGQPWLVNRLASIVITKIKPETIDPIVKENIDQAVNVLLKEKNSHFENLKEKIFLYIETFKSILFNPKEAYLPDDDAQSWLQQYGLIKEQDNCAVIANPIYKKRFSKFVSSHKGLENGKMKIFISYCHEDRHWLDRLVFHLTPLKYQSIEFWFDEHIKSGDNWSEAIQNAIQTSHMTIHLISPYFLNSDYIRTREIPAIQARQKEGMFVIPILIKKCVWKVIPFLSNIQMYPHNGIALEELDKTEQEDQLIQLVNEIIELFNQN